MSICFNGRGNIRLKKETAKEFTDKIEGLLKKCNEHSFKYDSDKNVFYFDNYARYTFMEDCKQIIEDNIDLIEEGKIFFVCDDEDGSVENPFPFMIMYEIVEGKFYEETLKSRLPFDWELHYAIK